MGRRSTRTASAWDHHRPQEPVVRRQAVLELHRRGRQDPQAADQGLERAGIPVRRSSAPATGVRVDIYTARPGIVIGRNGAEAERVRGPGEADRQAGPAEHSRGQEPGDGRSAGGPGVAEQPASRVQFRRAMRKAQQSAMRSVPEASGSSAPGVWAVPMSRSEFYREGQVPLHTLRADIDYGFHEAKTTFGRIGVKVWTTRATSLAPVRSGLPRRRPATPPVAGTGRPGPPSGSHEGRPELWRSAGGRGCRRGRRPGETPVRTHDVAAEPAGQEG
jgi:small subunit ribosomal protein S3